MASPLDKVTQAIKANPFLSLAVSNGTLACVSLYIISEGRPLAFLYKHLFRAALSIVPSSLVEAEEAKLKASIEHSVIGDSLVGELTFPVLPSEGLPKSEVVRLLDHYAQKDKTKWNSGKVSGAVYHGGQELTDVASEAYKRFSLTNPLHPDIFPLLRKMESETVAMCVQAFQGGPEACGTMTSGGTESILMAIKSYRDKARKERGVVYPELVAPVTAHAAFDKACAYFCIKLVHVPVDPVTFRAVPGAMAAACTPNTIALVCSAPSYPQGVVDPIPEVAAFALKRGLPLHVDACLGSLCVAHAKEAGFPQPCAFDFTVPGVTSISMDTHKYGFSPKGSSVVLYSSHALRRYQYFVAPEWTGGIYASPSIAGSRPGAVIAATWATMLTMGRKGYVDATRTILTAAAKVAAGIKAMGHPIVLLGSPTVSVVCFGPAPGSRLNIYNVNDAMSALGWNLNVMQNPGSVHVCVTYANAGQMDQFLEDLKAAVQDVLTAPPGKFKDGSGAMYGMAAAIPDKSFVGQISFNFLDALYKVPDTASS